MSTETALNLAVEWISELLNLPAQVYSYTYQFDCNWSRVFVIRENHGERVVGQVLIYHKITRETVVLLINDPLFVSKLNDACK